ncbi:hypothetical protein [Streptomyces sp. bgisy034]|uniref:hypothetical protein n=1 Tax=Streptomyces sp. bgisy034 TaxID=3413774 RepID=UPI003EBBC715
MPGRQRAEQLRSDMERVTGCAADVDEYPGRLRVSVQAPDDEEAWRALLEVLACADCWGSSDTDGQVRVWASVATGDSP